MSPDWPWPVILVLAAPLAMGHLYHFVLIVNVVSGLGYRESVLDRVRTLLFLALWASSAFLLWKHLESPCWSWPWALWSYALLCLVSGMIIWLSTRCEWLGGAGQQGSPSRLARWTWRARRATGP
jgi:hypothetical protein